MRFFVCIAMLVLLQMGSAHAEDVKFLLPEMVTVPAGSFMMGSPPGEPGRKANEDPRHLVTIAYPFAVGKYEVTFAEWDYCVADGGCRGYKPDDNGWGRGNRPVINVSWEDTQAYIAWLNRKTGKQFRLLSEAEWEYAARAGTTTAYYWGNDIGKNNANCKDCGSQWDSRQTAPVGSFQPNAFGLYDILGNVWEWTEDAYSKTYSSAPTDGRAWRDEGDIRHVRRGGSWHDPAIDLRAANRSRKSAKTPPRDIGFRLARTLP